MTGQAYIEYKEKGFWIPEAFIEVLSEYICQTMESIGLNTLSENLQEIYENCNANRKGVNLGIVNILFDDYVINEIDKNNLITIFEQTKTFMLSIGLELSIVELNAFENRKINNYFKNNWSFPIKTQSLVATIDIMEQLLNETWQSSNYSVYYVGFPNPAGVDEI
jgi:hypothetical protein